MKKLLCSAVLALSAVAMPVAAAPRPQTLPPGCFQLYPNGPIFCLDLPIERRR